MILLFPRRNDVDVRGWLFICHEPSQSELAIRIEAIQSCFELLESVPEHALLDDLNQLMENTRAEQANQPLPDKKTDEQNHKAHCDKARETLKRMELFHPGAPKGSRSFRILNLHRRRFCSAAVALTYLQTRGLLRVADKLAIVANLCDFNVRLNTIELEKTQTSLTTCVLALSLTNGDFSLLVPHMYQQPETRNIGESVLLKKLIQV